MRCTFEEGARLLRDVIAVERARVAGLEGLARSHLSEDELNRRPDCSIPHLRGRLAELDAVAELLEILSPHEAQLRLLDPRLYFAGPDQAPAPLTSPKA